MQLRAQQTKHFCKTTWQNVDKLQRDFWGSWDCGDLPPQLKWALIVKIKTQKMNCLIQAFPLAGLGDSDLCEGLTGTPWSPSVSLIWWCSLCRKYLDPTVMVVVKNSCKTQTKQQIRQIGFGRNNRPLNPTYLFSSLKEPRKHNSSLDISIQINYRHFRAAIALLFICSQPDIHIKGCNSSFFELKFLELQNANTE